MMGGVQVLSFGSQQLNRLSDASWLINRALLADGHMHGQVQKRVALPILASEPLRQRVGHIMQDGLVFGVLRNPLTRQGLKRVDQALALQLGIDLTKETSDIVL